MGDGRITRRGLLTGAAAAAAAATLGRGRRGAAGPSRAPGQVFSAYADEMVAGSSPADVQPEWVRAGLDACVCALTGQADPPLAWQAAFPGIGVGSRVAIKVNCLNDSIYPQFATLSGIVAGLTSMFDGAFPAGNIRLFDNNLWQTGKVEACYGAAELDGLGLVHGEDSYDAGVTVDVGGTTMNVSRAWAEADYGISLAKMAPHQYYAGGLSGVIKNMMGAVSLQTGTYEAKRNGAGFHDAAPFTAFRDLFANYAADHLQLYIVDMLFAARHENESGWAEVVRRITLGDDPCAVDAYNVDKINELGMDVRKTVTKDVPDALAQAGVGSTSYTLIEPEVRIDARPPSRTELDRLVRDRRDGQADDADVKDAIRRYREQ